VSIVRPPRAVFRCRPKWSSRRRTYSGTVARRPRRIRIQSTDIRNPSTVR
jgi:hypothetical protein